MNYLLGRKQPLEVRSHLAVCQKCRKQMNQLEDRFVAEARQREASSEGFFRNQRLSVIFSGLFLLFSVAPARLQARNFRFAWDAVAGCAGYEIQLSDTLDFGGTILQLVSYDAATTIKLEPGIFFWRVRAFDREGNRGQWSVARQLQYTRSKNAQASSEKPESLQAAQEKTAPALNPPAAAAPGPPAKDPQKEQSRAPETEAEKDLSGKAEQFEKEIDIARPVSGLEKYRLEQGKKLTLYFEGSDAVSGLDAIYIRLNNESYKKYPRNKLELENPGRYSISWYAIDKAGNKSQSRQREILIERAGGQ